MPFAVTLKDLEIIIRSEISQTEKDVLIKKMNFTAMFRRKK